VVRGIKEGGMDDSVHLLQPRRFFQLIFYVRAGRNFDDSLEIAEAHPYRDKRRAKHEPWVNVSTTD